MDFKQEIKDNIHPKLRELLVQYIDAAGKANIDYIIDV